MWKSTYRSKTNHSTAHDRTQGEEMSMPLFSCLEPRSHSQTPSMRLEPKSVSYEPRSAEERWFRKRFYSA